MKMYILVRDDIPLGFAMVAVAHASLAGYLRFQDEPEVREWLSGPFFKAVCKVNAKEFENAKQVADLVQMRLADGYLRQPKVAAEVIAYRPFFILGEVKAPGQYPYVSGLTALNAVATAQGFTPRAARSVIYIRRAGAAEEEAFKLTPELRVLPGDTLRLGERYF